MKPDDIRTHLISIEDAKSSLLCDLDEALDKVAAKFTVSVNNWADRQVAVLPLLLDLWRANIEEREAKYSYLDAMMGGVANEHDDDRRQRSKRNVETALRRLEELQT